MKTPSLKKTFISIGMPAFNEESNIEHVVKEAIKVLKKITKKYQVIVVNDGSKDSTGNILDRLAKKDPHIKVIHHKKRLGVGHANYHIYKAVKGDVLFWNASDNQIHMEELFVMLPHLEKADIIIGNRKKRADNIMRVLLSNTFNALIRSRFGIKVKDVDSVKVFKTSVFKEIVMKSRSAFIESEILIRAQKKGMILKEVPIKHYPRLKGKASGINIKIVYPQLIDGIKMFFNFL